MCNILTQLNARGRLSFLILMIRSPLEVGKNRGSAASYFEDTGWIAPSPALVRRAPSPQKERAGLYFHGGQRTLSISGTVRKRVDIRRRRNGVYPGFTRAQELVLHFYRFHFLICTEWSSMIS